MRAIYLLPRANYDQVYGPDERRDIARLAGADVPWVDPHTFADRPGDFGGVEAIFSGWGMPRMDAAFFDVFPHVKALFYAAGAVDKFITDEVWARGVRVSNANVANGFPVAEFTFAQIILCLKQAWRSALRVRRERDFSKREAVVGTYKSTVGILSLGAIGSLVAQRLQSIDVQVIAYDPFCPPARAHALNVTLCGLDDVFARADVVSCHTPWLPETVGMLTGAHFRAMKPNAAFINTARGAVVREDELIQVLRGRPDLFAALDVTFPEPPAADSALFDLPNVVLTPHIAGSMGNECWRMARVMVTEFGHWLHGEPLEHPVTREYARAKG